MKIIIDHVVNLPNGCETAKFPASFASVLMRIGKCGAKALVSPIVRRAIADIINIVRNNDELVLNCLREMMGIDSSRSAI